MWAGVDSDVELYASGRCLEDEGEWAGGQDLTGKQEQEQGAQQPCRPRLRAALAPPPWPCLQRAQQPCAWPLPPA
jgi:hypothetical protein